jgi:hypothetical protein
MDNNSLDNIIILVNSHLDMLKGRVNDNLLKKKVLIIHYICILDFRMQLMLFCVHLWFSFKLFKTVNFMNNAKY